jgi:A/G-specific adenine glycosylase
MPRAKALAHDSEIVTRLSAWFPANARDLPWRRVRGPRGQRNAYRSLVSELMLQQTQVSRVIEKYASFIKRFPTPAALAAAPQEDVLAEWSGLGYYRRAMHLHEAAKAIVERFGGQVPQTVEQLSSLPGVGRYTAGAIASIVFGRAEPIVDGNVARVLMRVEGKDLDPAAGMAWAWERAEKLVWAANPPLANGEPKITDPRLRSARPIIALLNEGLMELGATICTPKSPRCLFCPLQDLCLAYKQGRQHQIPRPKPAAAQKEVFFDSVILEDGRGRLLVERRPQRGLWAGLWQAPTLERADRVSRRTELEEWLQVAGLKLRERMTVQTSHRVVRVGVWVGEGEFGDESSEFGVGNTAAREGRTWRTRAEVVEMGLSTVQRRILMDG